MIEHVTATRVSQEERSRAMRLRLLDAAVDCLIERGYAGTSTTLVSERAGVSRGAQLHHFPSKAALLVAAVEHVAQTRAEELTAAAAATPPDDRRRVLRMLADHVTSPVFDAALELWVAARTDAELRAAVAPLERRIGRQTHVLAVTALRADETVPGTRELIEATLDLIRGLGLARALSDDTRRRNRVLDRWAAVLDHELGPATDREEP
ncbi:MAG TPA: TetR/AcrR family transcriptional regulator [Actinomycetota bacterium]|nr:TetR/AcrR family transcriptional regulator [Actinomycetota bacterium]